MTDRPASRRIALDGETVPPEVEQEIDAAIDAYIAQLARQIDEHMQRKKLDMSDATKDRKP